MKYVVYYRYIDFFTMFKNKNLLFIILLLTFSAGTLLFVAGADAATGLEYTLLEKIPGFSSTDGSNLPEYLKALYRFGLIAIVLSAVFMLSIGGFFYLTSAGNTSALSTAKSIIFDSLIGLVIALAAYLILNVINPDLVNVSINGLSATPVVPGAPTGPVPAVGQCTGCVPISGIASKPVGVGCAAPGPCQLNENFLNKLKAIRSPQGWLVNEAWPPTVPHSSACHSNGTCADLGLQNRTTNVSIVAGFNSAVKDAGLNVLYETFESCDAYTAAGVTCRRFNTTTGSHFHVY